MKRIFSHVIAALTGAAVAALMFLLAGRTHDARQTVTVDEAVTVDTVRAVAPLPIELIKVRFEPVKLARVAEVAALASLAIVDGADRSDLSDRSDAFGGRDGSRPYGEGDSVMVAVPIETKVFSDDSTYRAVVSGFRASLDTIDIYNRTVERTVSFTPEAKKSRRWGLSVGVGAVATPSGRIEPGVFAGISYQFVSF